MTKYTKQYVIDNAKFKYAIIYNDMYCDDFGKPISDECWDPSKVELFDTEADAEKMIKHYEEHKHVEGYKVCQGYVFMVIDNNIIDIGAIIPGYIYDKNKIEVINRLFEEGWL